MYRGYPVDASGFINRLMNIARQTDPAGKRCFPESRLPVCRAFIFAGISLFIAVLAVANLLFGDLNQDEGWYLYAARLVAGGELLYRDFAFTQGPVMPYVYSLVWPVIDSHGLAVGRLFSVLMFLACCAGAGCLAAGMVPRGRKSAAAAFALVLAGINAYQSYFSSVVKTYSLSGLLIIAGFLCLMWALRGRKIVGGLLSGIFLGLAAGTRLSAGIALPVAGLFLAVLHVLDTGIQTSQDGNARGTDRRWIWLWFGIGGLLALAVCFVPFLLQAPGNAKYWLFEYHAAREAGGWQKAFLLKAGSMARLVGSYFVPFAVLLCGIVWQVACMNKGAVKKPLWQTPTRVLSLCAWLVVVFVAVVHLSAPFPYDEYQVMIYPLFAAAAASFVVSIVPAPRAWTLSLLVLVLSLASVFSSPIVHNWYVLEIDRLWVRAKRTPPLLKLREAAGVVRNLAHGKTKLLTQDIYLAVESGMEVPRGLELGQFSYFPGMTTAEAEKLNVLNRPLLESLILTSDAPVAAFSGYGFAVKSPEVKELASEQREFFFHTLRSRYVMFRRIPDFGQAYTTLRIYLLTD